MSSLKKAILAQLLCQKNAQDCLVGNCVSCSAMRPTHVPIVHCVPTLKSLLSEDDQLIRFFFLVLASNLTFFRGLINRVNFKKYGFFKICGNGGACLCGEQD